MAEQRVVHISWADGFAAFDRIKAKLGDGDAGTNLDLAALWFCLCRGEDLEERIMQEART